MNKYCQAIDSVPQSIPFIDRSMMYANCVPFEVSLILASLMFISLVACAVVCARAIYKKRKHNE